MNYSRLIHDYLDGDLPKQKEELLFSEIANNSAMRTDFNFQMKLHLVAKQDLGVVSPPVSLTNAVFSQLGFASPNVAPIPTFSSQVYDFTRKNAVWLLLLLFVSTVSTTGYLIYKNNQLANELNNKKYSGVAFVNSEESESKDSENRQEFSAQNSSFENSQDNRIGLNIENSNLSANRSFYNKKNSTDKNFSISDNSSDNFTENTNSSFNNNTGKFLLTIDTQDQFGNSNNNTKTYSLKEFKNRNYSNNSYGIMFPSFSEALLGIFDYSPLDNTTYSIRIRNNQSLSSSTEFASLNSNVPFYNDLAIGSWYKLDKNHSIGVEFGMEKFSQQFKMKNGLEYIQNPELVWAGISYRLTLKEIFIPYTLYPYSELFAGATSVGPLFRAQTGLNYMISNNIGINIGVEYNTMYYNVEGTIYNSNKFGLTSGINLNF